MAGRRRGNRKSKLPIFELTVLLAILSYFYRDSAIALLKISIALVVLALAFMVLRRMASRRTLKMDLPVEIPGNDESKLRDLGTSKDLYPIWKTSNPINGPTPIDHSKWSFDLLRELEWKRFEEVAAEYYRLQGYDARTTRTGADGGVDIVIHDKSTGEPLSLVQCKAWNTRQVGVNKIRELLGVLAHNKIKLGIFMTTATFTAEAKDFARDNSLVLVDGPVLLGEIQKLGPVEQNKLLQFAISGDYTTPTCPNCDIKMALREGAGYESFWGCKNYPRCKQTFNIPRRQVAQ